MNLIEYLSLKNQRKLEDAQVERRELCLSCLRPTKACFCSGIVPIVTKTRFVFLMHPKEAKKEPIGTGRLSDLSLENSKIIVGENFEHCPRVNSIIEKGNVFLLYPGADSVNITKEAPFKESEGKVLFIIDGTWPCAKSMMRDSPNLHKLPKLSFDQNFESSFAIKQQPAKYCLSTIESCYKVLTDLEAHGLERLAGSQSQLLETLSKLVSFQVKCAADPSLKRYRRGSYKKPSERSPSKKWQDRSICFDSKNYS